MKKIKSISLRNSDFFEENFSLQFADKLNCLMGGRGTGKSTLLYFIKAALSEDAESEKLIAGLLKNNLNNGEIILCLQTEDGKEFEVRKSFGEEPVATMLPGGQYVTAKTLSDFIECDIYPALSIEKIGLDSIDRLELVDKRIKKEVDRVKSEIKEIQISMRQNAQTIRNENSRILELQEKLKDFSGAETDLKNWKTTKSEDISETDQVEFEKADQNEKIRSSEKRYHNKIISKLVSIESVFGELDEELQGIQKLVLGSESFINKDIISKINKETTQIVETILKTSEESRSALTITKSNIEGLTQPLAEVHQTQQLEFIKLKQKFEAHKEYITRYNQLSKTVDDKKVLRTELKELEAKRLKVKGLRESLVFQLNEKKKEIFSLRKVVADQLNAELNGSVKITLTFGGITDDFETRLRNALKGSNLRYNAIIPYILDSFSSDKFAASIHARDYETLKKITGVDEERSRALVDSLYETQEIYEIEAIYCEDMPEFFLRIENQEGLDKSKENYKRSDELSTGQRCTTVLPIVFAVSDNPLIIDQPEDNLDNSFIIETIQRIIRDQKERRQLIFITHNPNIPVVSDAELNVFLAYENKKSKANVKGTVIQVKESILDLLEGGRNAFKIRRELYGE
jgi:ABC-type lipoprotein export system ATPase subunit